MTPIVFPATIHLVRIGYPCATNPSCGMTHDREDMLIPLPIARHDVDHANRYVELKQKHDELVRKLRDESAIAEVICDGFEGVSGTYKHERAHPILGQTDEWLLSVKALLAYLGLDQKEQP